MQLRRLRLVFGSFPAWDHEELKRIWKIETICPEEKKEAGKTHEMEAEIKKSLWKSGQIPKILKIKAENEGGPVARDWKYPDFKLFPGIFCHAGSNCLESSIILLSLTAGIEKL